MQSMSDTVGIIIVMVSVVKRRDRKIWKNQKKTFGIT